MTQTLIISETTVELIEVSRQGLPGPPGAAGQAGASHLTYTASGAIGGHRLVRALGGGLVGYADNTVLADAYSVVGITQGAAANAASIDVQHMGEITEPTWTWTPGLPIFCGTLGVPTQTAPTVGFSLVIGVASSVTSIILNIQSPIII